MQMKKKMNCRPVESEIAAPKTLYRSSVSPAGIEILELNESTNSSNTNIERVKQQLRAYTLMNYLTLGDCIHLMELEDPEDIEYPDDLEELDPKTDIGGLKAHLYKKQIEETFKDRKLRKQELSALFGLFLSILSPSSQQRVFSAKQYPEIEEETDGF